MTFRVIENPSEELLDKLLSENIRTKCPDCQVIVGKKHWDHCDVARCLNTQDQRFGCACGQCGNDLWDGHWPGVKEAYERKYVCFDTVFQATMFDLNRVAIELQQEAHTKQTKPKPKSKVGPGKRKVKFKKDE